MHRKSNRLSPVLHPHTWSRAPEQGGGLETWDRGHSGGWIKKGSDEPVRPSSISSAHLGFLLMGRISCGAGATVQGVQQVSE